MFRVVLVSPLQGGNIGSVCRAMANMGVGELAVVAPRTEPGWEEAARMMAVHARGILDARMECATFEEAVADCAAVVGTTCRGGLYRQHVQTPRELAPELVRLAADRRVALVFGREDNGLDNDEIARCTHLLRIPSAPGYISLNLAQAAMVVLYEMYTARGAFELPEEKSPPCQGLQRQRLLELWRSAMLSVGFMKEDKADHMMQGFQRIFSRGVKTEDDAHIMMGVARQSEWASRNPCGTRDSESGRREGL